MSSKATRPAAGVPCPVCGAASHVVETRGVKRRRCCLSDHCAARFTTLEMIVGGRGPVQAESVIVPRRLLVELAQAIDNLRVVEPEAPTPEYLW